MSEAACNLNRPDVILMAVTSQIQSPGYFGDVAVADWQQAGLIKPSLIKPVFTTIEKRLVLRTLGRLSKNDRVALKETIRSVVGE